MSNTKKQINMSFIKRDIRIINEVFNEVSELLEMKYFPHFKALKNRFKTVIKSKN